MLLASDATRRATGVTLRSNKEDYEGIYHGLTSEVMNPLHPARVL